MRILAIGRHDPSRMPSPPKCCSVRGLHLSGLGPRTVELVTDALLHRAWGNDAPAHNGEPAEAAIFPYYSGVLVWGEGVS